MQIDQSQNQFLLEEESTRQFQNTPIKFCQVVEKSFDEQSKTNHDFIDSPLKKLNSHFNSPLQSSKNSYSPPQNLKKLNQSTQRIFDYIQQSHILGKKCDNIQLNSQDQNFSFNRANYSPNSQNKFKERLQKKVAFKEQEQIREERKEKILKGLKPLFLEMKIIKQVFQDLESVINYQINSQNQNQQNSMKTLFHFTQAKTIFQKLKNQTGLSRCYYNLGIIYLLKYDFSLGSEYFESAIQLNLESLGINYQDLTNQKFIDTSSIKTENQILILSKRLFSQAYCLKQQALQVIYTQENKLNQNNFLKYSQNDKEKNIEKLISNQQPQNQTLLQKSLEIFEIVLRLVQNNDFYFPDNFKIFLLQEIIEIILNLKESKKIQIYFETLDQLFHNQINQQTLTFITPNNYPSQKNIINEIKCKSHQNLQIGACIEIKKQIFQIQRSRQHFLFGLMEQSQKNYSQAIQQFTLCIEEGTHYNPSLRKKAIFHITQLFQNHPQIQIRENLFDMIEQQNIPIDLIVIIQLDYCLKYTTVENCLKSIQQSKFLKNDDRIIIQIYNQDLEIIIPLTHVYNEKHWYLIIDSLQNITKRFIEYEKKSKLQISWQEALFKSLNYVCQFNLQDQIYLNLISEKKKYINKDNSFNNLKNAFQCYKRMQSCQKYERQKVILLFSKEQECNKQLNQNNLIIQLKLFNYHKPIVYHLKEFSLFRNSKLNQQFDNLIYESFYDEHQLISRLSQLREEENINDQQEFLFILNNS